MLAQVAADHANTIISAVCDALASCPEPNFQTEALNLLAVRSMHSCDDAFVGLF